MEKIRKMKKKWLIAALAVVLVLTGVLASTGFAGTSSYSYAADGVANKITIQSADAVMGYIEPASNDGDFNNNNETWNFVATPNMGYEFDHWELSATNCVRDLNSNTSKLSFRHLRNNNTAFDGITFTATAFFKTASYTLTINKVGSNTANNGSTFTPASGTVYPAGTVIDLAAAPNANSKLVGFFGTYGPVDGYNCYTNRLSSSQITMDGNKTIYALFSSNNYGFEHIDVELAGTLKIDHKVNGVTQSTETLNIKVSNPTVVYYVNGVRRELGPSSFSTSGSELRALNIARFNWPDSISISATLTDQHGKTYRLTDYQFSNGEIRNAYGLCPGTEANNNKGLDLVISATDIQNTITHDVTFKTTDGGTINGASADIKYEGVLDGSACPTPPSTAAQAGYTYKGWTKNGGSRLYTTAEISAMTITENTEFTAQYVSEFRVRNNNGPGGDHGYIQVTYNGNTVNLDAGQEATFNYYPSAGNVAIDFVSDANYGFAYYVIGNGAEHKNNDPDAIDPSAFAGQPGANNRIDLNPKWAWVYTVTYNKGTNGSLDGAATEPVLDGACPQHVPGIVEDTGYDFIGWSSNGGTTLLDNAGVMAIPVTGNIAYTAYYEKEIYTVTYNKGASGNLVGASIDSVAYNEHVDYVPGITENPGYHFLGWSSDGGTTLLNADGIKAIAVTGSITYTAYYEQINYTIKYDLNGHGTTSDTVDFPNKHYGDITPTAPAVSEAPGWTFMGWSPVVASTVTGNATYVAQYSHNEYTVKYELGAHGTTSDQTEFIGRHYGDDTPTAPTVNEAPGWTFTSWTPVIAATVTGNVTYTAQYTQNEYTVKYDLGSHGTTSDRTEFTGKHYGDDTPTAPAVTQAPGWTFTSWTPVVSATVDGDVTYTAQYSQNEYTVKYDLGANGTTTDLTVFTGKHYGDATPAEPVVTEVAGWTFTGWSPVIAATVTDSVTYTAQYTQNVYAVKYDLGLHGTTTDTIEFTGKHYGDAMPTAPNVVQEAGWTFTGWLPVVSTTVTGDVVYVAQYTQNIYTVKYDLGAHGTTSNTTEFKDKHYGDATPPAPTVTEQSGWTFTAWTPAVSATITGDVTYTAQYTQNEYTVKYDLGVHGSTSNTTEFIGKHYGDATPAAPSVTEEAGWTFTGWTPAVATTVTGSVTYTAQYTQNVYTVKYDLGMHGTTVNQTEFTGKHYNDATPAAPAVTEEAGWTFTGWTPAVATTVTGDVTYTAQYTQNVYTVKYDLGAHGTAAGTTEFPGKHYGDATPAAPTVTEEAGWTFTGWTPAVNLTVTGDVTYTAQYTQNAYTVKYDLGSHGTTTDKTEFTEMHYNDATPTAPAVTTESGYTFKGWLPVVSATVKGDVTYTAQYNQDDYTVKYDLGTFGTTADQTEFTAQHYGDDTPTAPSVTEEAGWTFTGWLPVVSAKVTGSVTYTAQYTQNEYTVKYDLGSHGTTSNTTEFTGKHYNDATPAAPTVTEEAGWTFTGWLPVVSATVTGDVTYTAQYTQNNYTVKYDLGSHGSTTDTIEFTGKHYNDPTPTAPTVAEQAGWTFTGWNPAVSATVTGDVTYTAQYTQNEYTVKYDLGSHGTTTDETEFTGKHYGDDTPTAPGVTEEAGWTFTGWNPEVSDTVSDDITYVAQYTQDEYAVKYDLGEHGTTTETTEFPGKHYNDPTPAAPMVTEEEGWTFTGWLPVVSATVTGDVTYTAQYTQNEYIVKYDLGTHGTTTDTTEFTGKHYGDDTPVAPGVTVESGWTFTGWNPAVSDKVSGDITYAAQYTQNEYTVKYDLGTLGTTGDRTEFTGKHYGDNTPDAPAVSAVTGWTFTGWSPVVSEKVNGSVTYTAQYTQNNYAVKYDLGKHGSTTDTTVFTGKHYGDPTPAAPAVTAETGWTFTGWMPVVAGSVEGDVTYTAQYTQNVYTVKYDLGTHGTAAGATVFTGLHYNDATPAGPTVTANAGWTFTGWLPVVSQTVSGDVTYAAQYQLKEYTVKFVDSDGTTVLNTQLVSYGGSASAPPNPASPEGYHFTGWDVSFNPVTSDITVKAQYAINTYQVQFFRADGVTPIGTVQTVNWGGRAAQENAPSRTGATFAGWVLTGDNTAVTTSLTNVRENISAVASYDRDVFVVRFEDYNGTLIGTDDVLYGGNATAPDSPTRDGYDFTSWSPTYNNVTGNMTVVAEYTIKTFTVTFTDFDGTVIDTQTVDWNTGATAPAAPEREGFTFTGWDKAFDPVTANVTVTAQYEAIGAPTPAPTQITEEPVPLTGGSPSLLWWLLLIPGLGLLIWFLFAWLSIVPIAEAVTNNGDGTMTIQWGYENRKGRKKKVDEEDSQLTVLSGRMVRNDQVPPVEFEKGRVENVFNTIAAAGSKVQWKIKNRKAKVDLKKVDK